MCGVDAQMLIATVEHIKKNKKKCIGVKWFGFFRIEAQKQFKNSIHVSAIRRVCRKATSIICLGQSKFSNRIEFCQRTPAGYEAAAVVGFVFTCVCEKVFLQIPIVCC